MSSKHPSVPAPESAEFFMPPVDRLFDPKLAERLQLSETDPDSLISESAKALLSAERDLMEALMIIQDMRSVAEHSRAPKSEPEIKAEVQAIQPPVSQQLKPIEGIDTDVPAANITKPGFQPVVYKSEESDLSEDDDSGLDVISADPEADERIFEDFGFDETAEEPDEWDKLYCRIKEVQLLERIVKNTGSKDIHQMAEKLRKDPDFHTPEKDKGKKN